MELTQKSLAEKSFWQEHQIAIPQYDRDKVIANTKAGPKWLHFGPGNIFRAFIADIQETLLNKGEVDYGIIAGEPGFPELIEKVYKPHDNLGLVVIMNPDQSMTKKVVGSITEALVCNQAGADWQRLVEVFRAPSLQIVSFTITEKGYQLKNTDGTFQPKIAADLKSGPVKAQSFPGRLTALVYERYLAGKSPLTLLSLDNCSHNGAILKACVMGVASAWEQANLVQDGFTAYLESQVKYPWSMIDKITPRPAPKVQDALKADGFTDMDIIKNSNGGYFAPFVNAEKTSYLVVEDDFANGRPPLDKGGVILTDRATVEKVERMKVTTCLNPLHTTLAVYGCLLGYTLIADEMKDPELNQLVRHIGAEGMKVVTDPGVLSPKDFLEQCLEVRFPNPAIPDTPQRIACDTSQKVGIRFGETIKAYGAKAGELKYLPLAIAGWCRYLLALDDKGQTFELSFDPLLPQLKPLLAGVKLGEAEDVHAKLQPILSDASIFGSDLYATELGTLVEKYFSELIAGPGAVRATLKHYLG